MTQQQWVTLCFRIALIAGFAAIATWIGVYTKLARWWRNPVGRSLVLKSGLLALLMVPTALSLFLNFNRLTSMVAAWIDVAIFALIALVMAWRTVIWVRLHKAGGLRGNGEGK